MKYGFMKCKTCGKFTVHFGENYPKYCIRHNRDGLESLAHQPAFNDGEELLTTSVDKTFLWMERRERECENVLC